MAPRSQEPQQTNEDIEEAKEKRKTKGYYLEFKVQKEDAIYLASFVSDTDENFLEETKKKLEDEGYTNIEELHHRRSRNGDMNDLHLLKIIPKKYEVTFRIKMDNVKYKKCFIIESTDENKVCDLAKQRCNKEFSRIRSITKMTYKLADENSREYSEVIKEPKNKIINKSSENASDVNLMTQNNIENSNVKRVNSIIPKNLRLDADHEELDAASLTNIKIDEDNKKKQFVITPTTMLVDYSKYKWYIISTVLDTHTYIWPARVFAKSSSNALMMFSVMVNSKKDLKIVKLTLLKIIVISLVPFLIFQMLLML